MVGFGSGNWVRYGTKSTVEQSLTLAVKDLRGKIHPRGSGSFTWTWPNGDASSIGFSVTFRNKPTLTLRYCWRDSEEVQTPVRLQVTPTHFGGHRWWFTCPLTPDGTPCKRRVGKLHLPPDGKLFGCRKCHNLTYQSCQEAHQWERMLSFPKRMESLERRFANMHGGEN